MARGFDSKFVEAQQEEAARGKSKGGHSMSPAERGAEQRRRTLELTRTRTEHDLSRATAPAHREMLQQALAALDREIRDLTRRG
jgi:hypothetical protein